jgi:hypothetical protein
MVNALVRHMPAGKAPQFFMYERDQLFQRSLIARAPVDQQSRDVGRAVCLDHHGRTSLPVVE